MSMDIVKTKEKIRVYESLINFIDDGNHLNRQLILESSVNKETLSIELTKELWPEVRKILAKKAEITLKSKD